MIDLVESGDCLGLVRDCILDRITRNRNFVIADKVTLTCDLRFACLTSRRHEADDLACVLGDAGGMGVEARRRRAYADRSGKIAERRAKVGSDRPAPNEAAN